MLAQEVLPFVPEKFVCEIHIPSSISSEIMTQARSLLSRHPGPYAVCVIIGKKRMHLHERISLEAFTALRELLGHDALRMIQS